MEFDPFVDVSFFDDPDRTISKKQLESLMLSHEIKLFKHYSKATGYLDVVDPRLVYNAALCSLDTIHFDIDELGQFIVDLHDTTLFPGPLVKGYAQLHPHISATAGPFIGALATQYHRRAGMPLEIVVSPSIPVNGHSLDNGLELPYFCYGASSVIAGVESVLNADGFCSGVKSGLIVSSYVDGNYLLDGAGSSRALIAFIGSYLGGKRPGHLNAGVVDVTIGDEQYQNHEYHTRSSDVVGSAIRDACMTRLNEMEQWESTFSFIRDKCHPFLSGAIRKAY